MKRKGLPLAADCRFAASPHCYHPTVHNPANLQLSAHKPTSIEPNTPILNPLSSTFSPKFNEIETHLPDSCHQLGFNLMSALLTDPWGPRASVWIAYTYVYPRQKHFKLPS